jgi:tape measure domain-containing protein
MSGIVIDVEARVNKAESSLEKLNDVVKSITANVKNIDKSLDALSMKKEVPLDKTEKALNNLSPKIDKLQSSTDKLFKGSLTIDNKYAKEFVNIGVTAEAAGKRVEKAFNDITLKPNDAALKNFSAEIDRTSRKISKQMAEGISKKDLRDTESSLQNINKSITGVATNINSAVSSISTAIAAFGTFASVGVLVKSLSDITSSFTEIESKIAMVTGRTNAFAEAQSNLLKIAAETRTTYAATADAFSGVGRSMKDVGATSEQLYKVTKALQQAQALSGGSSEGFKAAMMQLNQGLSSGALRGEELNSVLEQAPAIADALARSLHVSTGALKGIAEQGKLTTSVVFGALLKQADYLNSKFKLIAPTLGNAMEAGFEGAKRFGYELDKGLGLSQDLAKSITKITTSLNTKTSGIRVFAADFDVKLKEATIKAKAYIEPLSRIVTALGQEFYRVFSSWKIPDISQGPLDDIINKFKLLDFILGHTDPAVSTKIIFRRIESAIIDGIDIVRKLLDRGITVSDKFILPIIDKVEEIYPQARNALLFAFNNLKVVIKDAMSILSEGFEIGTEFIKPIIKEINKLPEQLVIIFDKVSKALFSAARGTDEIARGMANVIDSITVKTGDLDSIYEYLNNFKDKVINIFFKIWDAVIGNSWWTDTIDTIISTSKSLWENASPGLMKFRDSIIALFHTISKTIRTLFNDALVKLNIESSSVSLKIPISIGDAKVQFKELYSSFIRTFDQFKDDFPLLFKAIAAGIGAVLAGMFLPSGSFAVLVEAALISSAIQSATLFAETLGRDLGDASLVAGLGTNLGIAAGKLFASFLSNLPLILSSLLGFIGEFTKEFLKQLPIIGWAFKGLFGLAGTLGLGGVMGLVGALFFGKGILGLLKTFGIATKGIEALEARLLTLGKIFSGEGGLISKLLFGGGRAFRIVPLLGLIAVISGAFDGLFNDSTIGKLILAGGFVYFALFGKEGLAGFARVGMLVRANLVGILSEFTATAGLAASIAAGGAFGPMLMGGIRNFRNFFRGLSAMSAMFFSSSLSSWAQYFSRWVQVTGFSGSILTAFKGFYDKIFGPITAASFSFAPVAQSFVKFIDAIKTAIVGFIMSTRAAGIALGGWIAALTRLLLGAPGILIVVGLISAFFSKSADAAELFREESNKGFFENLTDSLSNIDILGELKNIWDQINAIDFSGIFGTNFKISIWMALTAASSLLLLFSSNVRKTFMLLAGDLLVFSGKTVLSLIALFNPMEVIAAAVFMFKAGLLVAENFRSGFAIGMSTASILRSVAMQFSSVAGLLPSIKALGVTLAAGLFSAFSASSLGLIDFSGLSVIGFTIASAFLYPLLKGIRGIPLAMTTAFSNGNILLGVGALAGKILLKFLPLGMMAAGAFAGAWAGGQFGSEMAALGGIAGAMLVGKFTEVIMESLTVFFAEVGAIATLGWIGLAITAIGAIGVWLFGSNATTLSQDLDNIIEKVKTLFGMKPNPIDVKTGLRLQDLLDASAMGIDIKYKIDPIKMELTTDSAKEAVVKATEELADSIRDAKKDWDVSGLTNDQRSLLQSKVKATAARVDAAAAASPFSFKNFGQELTARQTYRPDTTWGQFEFLLAQQSRDAMYNVDRAKVEAQMKLPQNAMDYKQLELRSQMRAIEASKATRYNASYSPLSADSEKLTQLTKSFDNLMPAPPKLIAHLKDVGQAILATTEKINSAKWGPWRQNETPQDMIDELAKFQKEYKATAEQVIKYSTLMRQSQGFASRLSSIASKFDMKGVESKLDTNKIFANSDTAVNRMEQLGNAAERLSKSLEGVFDIKAKNDIILNIEEVVKQKERLREDSAQSYKYSSPAISKMAEDLGLSSSKAAIGLPENISSPVLTRMKELQRQREDFLNKPVKPVNPDLIPQDFIRETPENKAATEKYFNDFKLWQTQVKNQEELLKTFAKAKENDPLSMEANRGSASASRELARLKIAEPLKPVLDTMSAKEQQVQMEKLRKEYKEKLALYNADNFEYFDKYMKNLTESFDLGDQLRKELWANVKTQPGQMADVATRLNVDIGDLYETFGTQVAASLLQQVDDTAAAIERATATQQFEKLPALKQRKESLMATMAIPEFKARGAMAESMGVEQSLIPGISKEVLDSLEIGFKRIKEIDRYLEVNKKTMTDAQYQTKLQEKLNAQIQGKKTALDINSKTAAFDIQARTGTNLTGAQLTLISQQDLDNLKTAELNLAKIKLDLDDSNDNADTLAKYFKALADQAEARYQASRNAASKTGAGMLQSLSDAGVSGASKIDLMPANVVQNVIKLSNYIKDLKHLLERPTKPAAFATINKEIAKTESALNSIKDAYVSFQDKVSTVNEVFGSNFTNMDFVSLGVSLTNTLMNVAQSLKSELTKELEQGFLSVRAESIIKVLDTLTTTSSYLKFFTDFKKSARESLTDGMKTAFDKIKSIAPNFGFNQSQFQMMDKNTRDMYSKKARDASALTAIQGLNGLTEKQTGIINQKLPVDEMMKQLIASFDTSQLKQYEKLTSTPEDVQLKAADIQLEAAKMNLEAVKGKATEVPDMVAPIKDAAAKITEVSKGPRVDAMIPRLSELTKDIPWSSNAPKPKFRPDVERWDSLIQDAVKEFPRVTVDMVKAAIEHESRGLNIKSGITPKPGYKETSFGLGQFNDATAKTFGVDKTDPASTIRGIAQYLSLNMKTFGNTRDAFRAYAVGPTGAKQGLGQDKADEFMTTLATGRAPKSAPITVATTSSESIKPFANSVAKPIEEAVYKQGELSKEYNVDLLSRLKDLNKQSPLDAYNLDMMVNKINPTLNTPAEMLQMHGAKLGKDVVSQMSDTQIALATNLNVKLLDLQQKFESTPTPALQQSITVYSEALKSFTEGVAANAQDLELANMAAFSNANSTNITKFAETFGKIGSDVSSAMSEIDKKTYNAMLILKASANVELQDKKKNGESTVELSRKIADLTDAEDMLKEKTLEAANAAREAGKAFSDSITSTFKDAFKGLLNQNKDEGKSVLGTFASKIGANIKDQVVNMFTDSFTNTIGLGKGGPLSKAFNNAGKGISSMFSGIGSGVKDIFTGNMTWDKFTGGISSWWNGMTSSDETANMSPEEIQMSAAKIFADAVNKFAGGGVGGALGTAAKAASGGGIVDMLSSAFPWLAGGAGVLGAGYLLKNGISQDALKGAGFGDKDIGSINNLFGNSGKKFDPFDAGLFDSKSDKTSNFLSDLFTQKSRTELASSTKSAGGNPWADDGGKGMQDVIANKTDGMFSWLWGDTGLFGANGTFAKMIGTAAPKEGEIGGLWGAIMLPITGLFRLISAGITGLMSLFGGNPGDSGAANGTNVSSNDDFVGPVKAATGGKITGAGTGTSDSIAAMLSNGEFVINAKAAKENMALLEAINSGKVIRRSAGGIIGSVAGVTGAVGSLTGSSKLSGIGGIVGALGNLVRAFGGGPDDKLLAAAEHLEAAATALENAVNSGGLGKDGTPGKALNSAMNMDSLMSNAKNWSSGGMMDSIKGFFSNGMNSHGMDALGGQSFGVLQSDANHNAGSYGVLQSDANSSINGADPGNSFGVMQSDANSGGFFEGIADWFKNIDFSSMFNGFATGGQIRGAGSSTSDSIPAMLSNGEFIVNAAATAKNLPMLHGINNGEVEHHFLGALAGVMSIASSGMSIGTQAASMADGGGGGGAGGIMGILSKILGPLFKMIGPLAKIFPAIGNLFGGGGMLGSLFSSSGASPLGAAGDASLGSMFSPSSMGFSFGKNGGLFLASGGMVTGPGTSTSDSIPAMLSSGEYVIRASAVSQHRDLLHQINSGQVPTFATGGVVGAAAPVMATPTASGFKSVTTTAGANKGQQVINLNITGDISRQTKSEIYKMMPSIADGVNSQNKETGYKR